MSVWKASYINAEALESEFSSYINLQDLLGRDVNKEVFTFLNFLAWLEQTFSRIERIPGMLSSGSVK